MTKILNGFSEIDTLEAVNILKNGGIVALPTETVYGLAADSSNLDAVRKVFKAKNRPENHPLILHIKSLAELPQYVKNISHDAKLLAENFWAGPMTMLFHKSDLVSNVITGNSDKIAIRVPANTIFQEVLRLGNFALVAPSANLHKKLSPTKAEHVMHQMNGLIDAILDGGQCKIGVESTIVDVTTNEVKILRAGPVLQKDIEHILNKKIEDLSISSANNVSGSMKIHYKPNKPVFLTDVDGVASYKSLNAQCVFIGYSQNFCNMIDSRLLVRMPCNATGYQAKLYDVLYELDAGSAEIIVVEMPPQTQDWLATNDKLNRMTDKGANLQRN